MASLTDRTSWTAGNLNDLADAVVALQAASGGSSAAIKLSAQAQATHGFTVAALTPVRHNGTIFVKSEADSLADAEVHAIAVATDANTFDLYLPGSEIVTTGATAGIQYLSPTSAGVLTATQPSTPGQVVKTVGVYVSTTVFLFAPMASEYIAATPYYERILGDAVAVTVADLGYFEFPSDLVGATLYSAETTVRVAPTGNGLVVGLKNNGGSAVFSTNPVIATGKKTSSSAGSTPAVVNAANAVVSADDVWTVHGVTADGSATDRALSMLLRFK